MFIFRRPYHALDCAIRILLLTLVFASNPLLAATHTRLVDATSRQIDVRDAIGKADELFNTRQYTQATKTYLSLLVNAMPNVDEDTQLLIATRIVSTMRLEEATYLARNAVSELPRQNDKIIILAKIYHLLANGIVAAIENTDKRNSDATHNSSKRENRLSHWRKLGSDNAPGMLKISQAQKLYIDSLALAPDAFDAQERLRIANWLSQINSHEDGLRVATRLVSDQPRNLEAYFFIAQTHITLERYTDAISATDKILAIEPTNIEAALLRARALHNEQLYSEAISQFRALLSTPKAFEARMGLANTYIATGQIQDAETLLSSTSAINSEQEDELYEILQSVHKSKSTTLDITQTQYEDSDFNRTNDIGIAIKKPISDWDLLVSVRKKTANGELRNVSTSTYTMGTSANITDQTKIIAKVGVTQLEFDDKRSNAIGQANIDTRIRRARITFNASQETLTATAYLIEDKVQMSRGTLTVNMPLPHQLSIRGNYARKSFSDNNNADEAQASIYYKILRYGPLLTVGYMYRYSNFDHPTTLSYFDPQDFYAQQVIFNFAWEPWPYYIYFETDIGQQRFSRKGIYRGSGFFGYATATVGAEMFEHWTVEFIAERSNSSSLEIPEVYGDSTLSGRISYRF